MDPTKQPTRVESLKKKKKKNSSLPLAGTTSLASVESLSMPLEVVIWADMSCLECQSRVADVLSRMEETESVLVDVLEKTVTLTRRYPSVKVSSSRQISAVNKKPFGNIALMRRILSSSST